MSLLALLSPLLGGCVTDCPNCVRAEDLDALVDARVEAAVAQALADATFLTAAEGDERYVSSAGLDALDSRVSTIEADYATSTDLIGYAAESLVAEHDEAIAALQADVAAIPGGYLPVGSLAGYAEETWVTENFADKEDFAALETSVTTLEGDAVRVLSSDDTWEVVDAPDLLAKLAELDTYRIASDVTLTIQLADGPYTLSEPLTFHHPDGGRVRIEGNLATPESVELAFEGCGGVVVDEGSALGFLGGVWLHGDSTTGDGLLVHEASTATIGPMWIQDFGGNGIAVTGASYVVGDTTYAGTEEWLVVMGAGESGIHAEDGGVASVPYAEVSGSLYDGFVAERNSFIYAPYAVASDNGRSGFSSDLGSYLDAHAAVADENVSYGFNANHQSGISASSSTASNTENAYNANFSSELYVPSAVATGSGGWAFASIGQSYVLLMNAEVSDGGKGIYTSQNGFVKATGSTSTDNFWQYHDTTDFIEGL